MLDLLFQELVFNALFNFNMYDQGIISCQISSNRSRNWAIPLAILKPRLS